MGKSIRIAIFLLLIPCLQAMSQGLYKVSMEEKVNNSTLIVEGKVISQKSFWNPQHTMIYTANKVEVTKVFKGPLSTNTIEVLTVGGSVEGDYIEASELLSLSKDQIGIFFCYPNAIQLKSPETKKTLLDVYASAQGFLGYDLVTKKATAPFAEYRIVEELYPAIENRTGRAFINMKPGFNVENLGIQNRTNAVSITGFSPATVNAGALLDPATNILTITGSGFGTASGSAAVLFDDANDGTGGADFVVAYNDPLIISWADNQIQVRVPSRAGTGTFRVRDASGGTGSSPSVLNVSYSILTATFNISSVLYTKEANLMNANGSGGYTIVYSTNTAGSGVDFDASPAKATFQRALNTWKEISGLNVIEGGTTTAQNINASDGVNIIMFDNANTGTTPLPSGVLAVCYSSFSMCTADPVNFQARKLGFDIVVRNSGFSTGTTTFTIGPCPPNASNFAETDLETVLLHELGHALNLGHINDSYQGSSVGAINPGKLMNYAVVNSVKRVTPDYSAKVGAAYAIVPQGNPYGTCTAVNTEMVPLSTIVESKDECPGSFPASITPRNTLVSFDLVHATSNKNIDPIYTRVRCDGVGASQTNNAWYALKTNSVSGGTLDLIVSNYTTSPAALTTCTQVYAGVPVTGIRLSVYQVSSCPAPGAFPTPIACNIFTTNGALSPIAVNPNTTYLLYLEGVENTKATFDLNIGGIALPLRLKNFDGNVLSEYNLLSWQAEAITGVSAFILQKSQDGVNFQDIATFNALKDMENGGFKDYSPFSKTYYRLAFKHFNQQTEYSSIVQLQRQVKNAITVYPNPSRDIINIQLNNTDRVVYQFRLYNNVGQLVNTISRKADAGQIKIPVKGLPKGVYQLVVTSDNHTENHKVVIE